MNFISDNLGVNEMGHLTVGGQDTVSLAEEYGTPLYLMDEDLIRKNMREYRNAIESCYGKDHGRVLYASKAFCTKAICRIADEEGLGLDVVSAGELYTALKAAFPAEKIYFHGNNKTDDELRMAVLNNVGRVIVDNIYELKALDKIAGKENKRVKIQFRLKPGIDAHTHDYTKTGQIDSKFGTAIENGEAYDIIKTALSLKNVEYCGIHCHIGSQIFDIEPFEDAAEIMIKFIKKIKDELGAETKELNLGGGYGIKYVEKNDPVPYGSYIEKISARVRKLCSDYGLELPFILMEPGRSIAGPAGVTLYTVGGIKKIKGHRNYASIDGGMGDNPRYALYKSEYDVKAANKMNEECSEVYTIAGKCCESGDLIQEHVSLPELDRGDILAVLATGAYNFSMASNYNRIPRPAVIGLSEGKSRILVRRESYEDIIKNDM